METAYARMCGVMQLQCFLARYTIAALDLVL